jgi:hypothetical protein
MNNTNTNTNNTEDNNSLSERQDVTCSEERTELSQSSGSPLYISISLEHSDGEKYISFSGLVNLRCKLRDTDIDFMVATLSCFKDHNIDITPIYSSDFQSSEKIKIQRSSD